jgi:hypothetical protein
VKIVDFYIADCLARDSPHGIVRSSARAHCFLQQEEIAAVKESGNDAKAGSFRICS